MALPADTHRDQRVVNAWRAVEEAVSRYQAAVIVATHDPQPDPGLFTADIKEARLTGFNDEKDELTLIVRVPRGVAVPPELVRDGYELTVHKERR